MNQIRGRILQHRFHGFN